MHDDAHLQPDNAVFPYLRALGYSEPRIAAMNASTRLYHDLGIFGDDAIEYMQLLHQRFGVDLSRFDVDRYFPPEFEGRNKLEAFFLTLIPFSGFLLRRRRSYPPLMLAMIDRSIRAKRWMDEPPLSG